MKAHFQFLRFSLWLLLLGAMAFLMSGRAPGQQLTILHSFDDGSVTNDAYNPISSTIIGSDGNFYGVSQQGGTGINVAGVIYKMTLQGQVTIVHNPRLRRELLWDNQLRGERWCWLQWLRNRV